MKNEFSFPVVNGMVAVEHVRYLQQENEMLRLALKDIATTQTQHLRSNQMQVALHGMKAKARTALGKCQPSNLEKALPWL